MIDLKGDTVDKVIVKVKGAGSLEVEGVEASEVFKEIDMHLGSTKAFTVHKIKRGPRPKSKAVSSSDS